MAISKGLELAISNLFVSQSLSTELTNLLNNSSSGGIAWRPPVRVLDSVSTIMPLAGPVTIDDVVMQNGDRILYTNLSDPDKNNRVYKIVGLTGDLRLILEVDKLPGDGSPSDGDSLIVEEGTDNADRVQIFDGTAWGGLSVGPTGDTFGPASSVDYAIARFDGTTGKQLQQSPVLINDSGSFFWTPDNTATIGQAGDNRPKRIFVAENIDIGNIVGGAAGFLHAGVGSTLYTITGSDNGNQAIMCFTTTLANAGFVHHQGDTLGTIKIFNNSGGYADYFKFEANAAGGSFTLMKAVGANILWSTDGAGNIGGVGANRPNNVYVKTGVHPTSLIFPSGYKVFDNTVLHFTDTAGTSNLLDIQDGVVSTIVHHAFYDRLDLKNAGSAALPKIRFDIGPSFNTGIYQAATNTIDISNAGVSSWQFDASGNLKTFADGVGNIGTVGANRPYSVNVSNDIEVGGASGTHLNSGQIYGPSGTAGTPTFSFNTVNMGIYASSGTTIGLTFFGTQSFEFSPTNFKLYDANNILWNTDGGGSIGASGANRPNHIYTKILISLGGITTAVRDGLTPSNGMIIYNSDTNKHQGYNGTWNDLY